MLENKPRRQFSRDFKIRAVELLLNGDRTVKSVAREIGVDPSSLRYWKRQYISDQEEAFPGKGHLKARDQELQDLRKRVVDLEEENQILKKAISIFTKQLR